MKIYSENENYKLYQGNMLDMLEVIEPNTIDSIVCDPPYELNFMGKGWDDTGIAFQKETWKQCYEALKEGGYLLAFGGSRTYHRIACAIEDAGFEIRDTIMWIYGSGFPKSMDISKQIDKVGGSKSGREKQLTFTKWLKSTGITAKQVNDITNTNMGGHYLTQNEQPAIPTKELFEKIRTLLNVEVPKYIEKLIDEGTNKSKEFKNREVIGKMENPASSIYSMGENKMSRDVDITLPSTDLAKQWQGWGTCLKPAFEPVIVARKPFKGSLVDNVINNGVGGLNIDECRVGNEERFNPKATLGESKIYNWNDTTNENDNYKGQIVNGRFPANVILTYDDTDYEEVCGGFPNTKEGSASRYYYTAKASKKDRDEGLDEFEENKVNDGRNTPIDNAFQRGETPRKNTHPTVKPTDLMQYLVRLVTPKGGTILDPFNGSGSTGKAVMYENRERQSNYKYIGIELTEEYLPIAKARIEYVENLKEEKSPQMTIFNIENLN